MINDADLAACRALLKGGSRSFHTASLLLPRRVADPATALYAFCRLADDAVDLGQNRMAAVALLRQRLDDVYRGQPRHAVDRAFADVVQRFAIPHTLPAALLEGLAWDGGGRRYDTLDDLTAYAMRVAGSVGAMMALIMGVRAPDTLARACDLGVAMQFTNIARDVGEDARAGRLYLPLQWMREAGIDPDIWLMQPAHAPPIAAMVQRLLDTADELYLRADAGIAQLPRSCRPGMSAARALYAEIGREVERAGLDSVSRRAVVPPRRKLVVAASAMFGAGNAQASMAPPLEAARAMIEAVEAASLRHPQWKTRSVEDRLVWVLDLFTRLAERDAMQQRRVFK